MIKKIFFPVLLLLVVMIMAPPVQNNAAINNNNSNIVIMAATNTNSPPTMTAHNSMMVIADGQFALLQKANTENAVGTISTTKSQLAILGDTAAGVIVEKSKNNLISEGQNIIAVGTQTDYITDLNSETLGTQKQSIGTKKITGPVLQEVARVEIVQLVLNSGDNRSGTTSLQDANINGAAIQIGTINNNSGTASMMNLIQMTTIINSTGAKNLNNNLA